MAKRTSSVPCTACGRGISSGGVSVEPHTGLPARAPLGQPFHAKCRPLQRSAACYVCHMAGPVDYDALVAAEWACENCGGEMITISWGRPEFRPASRRSA